IAAIWSACFTIAAAPLATPVTAGATSPVTGANPCDRQLLSNVPSRPEGAATGSEFVRRVQDLSGAARDALVRSELVAGNLPDFLRHLIPVTLHAAGTAHTLTVCVLPDYLAIGTNRDFVF